MAALALSDATGPVNLSSGHGVSFADLAAMANGLAGADVISPDARSLGPGEPEQLIGDATKLRETVGFEPPEALASDLKDYAASITSV